MDKQKIGYYGECLAEQLLISKNYTILSRNFRCRFGEIDIIARQNGTIACVEVKTRTSDTFGTGREAVSVEKQKHMRRAMEYYLQTHNIRNVNVDFQVVEITLNHFERIDALGVM